MTEKDAWLPIQNYSQVTGMSDSTIRRHIKNKKLKYKKEEGRYYIWISEKKRRGYSSYFEKEILQLKLNLEFVENELKKVKEQNFEYKMLISIYEREKLEVPPELPRDFN